MRSQILSLDHTTYRPHALHEGERRWSETNCYVDVWIELLHALGHDPHACLGFTVRTDLEADQWTFFKPPHAELDSLYGIEVGELNIWSSLVDQVQAEVAAGHPVLVELDAWFLPDTRGTTYRTAHSKTTVAVNEFDPDARTMGYFHSAGYHWLEGEDFDSVLRLDSSRFDPAGLAPYAEFVKPGAAEPLRGAQLRCAAVELLRAHVRRAPTSNPFSRYRTRFQAELETLPRRGPDYFHAYAFANFRQIGASFELAAAHIAWLGSDDANRPALGDMRAVEAQFLALAASAKSLQMKAARRALAKRDVDATADLDSMEHAWDTALAGLRALLG